MNHAAAARFLLAVCFLVLLFSGGARFAIGLLLHPMAHDLSWSRSTLSLSVTVFMVLSACALPLVGHLVDRFGARAVLAVSVLATALALAAMSLVESPWEALLVYGVVFALGCAGTSITPVGVLLSRWYPHRMGMANSIAISGMGVGQLLVISVLAVQLTTLGWRGSFLALGVATLVCVLPFVLAMTRVEPSEQAAPPPDPGAGTRTAATAAAAEGEAETLREALAARRLQLLLVIYVVCGFQDFLVATHMVAFALDEGVDTLLAGNMLAFMGLTGLAGVLLAGVLNDRFGPVLPTALCFALRIVLCAVLLLSREPTVICRGGPALRGDLLDDRSPGGRIRPRERIDRPPRHRERPHHHGPSRRRRDRRARGRIDLRRLRLVHPGVRRDAGPLRRRPRSHPDPAAATPAVMTGLRHAPIDSVLCKPGYRRVVPHGEQPSFGVCGRADAAGGGEGPGGEAGQRFENGAGLSGWPVGECWQSLSRRRVSATGSLRALMRAREWRLARRGYAGRRCR